MPDHPITTGEPNVTVDESLAVGRHRFRLVVVDSAGNRSKPAEVDIIVAPRRRRTIR